VSACCGNWPAATLQARRGSWRRATMLTCAPCNASRSLSLPSCCIPPVTRLRCRPPSSASFVRSTRAGGGEWSCCRNGHVGGATENHAGVRKVGNAFARGFARSDSRHTGSSCRPGPVARVTSQQHQNQAGDCSDRPPRHRASGRALPPWGNRATVRARPRRGATSSSWALRGLPRRGALRPAGDGVFTGDEEDRATVRQPPALTTPRDDVALRSRARRWRRSIGRRGIGTQSAAG
jgi:hypothetical protein